MALTITITFAPMLPAVSEPLVVLQQHARQAGNPDADRGDLAGVTIPRITIDQRGLRYRQRAATSGVEFQFDTGTLALTVSIQVYMLSTLSPCERRLWEAHENRHVADYQNLGRRLRAGIAAEPTLRAIFVHQQWLPRDAFDLTQATIHTAVVGVFEHLTRQASQRRDSAAEYARVRREVQLQCNPPTAPRTGGHSGRRATLNGAQPLWR